MESGAADVKASRWAGALHIMAGSGNPLALAEAAVAASAARSGGARPRTSKRLPPYVDNFGWCSWDAFYSRVSASGLHSGVASLAAGGAPPRTVIIDDGWQSTDLDPAFRRPPPPPPPPQAAMLSGPSRDVPARACAPAAVPSATSPPAFGGLEAEAAAAAAAEVVAAAAAAGAAPASGPATPPRAGSVDPDTGGAREATPLPSPPGAPAPPAPARPSTIAGALASLETAVENAVASTADEFEAAEREVLERLAVRDVPAGSSLSSALAQLAQPERGPKWEARTDGGGGGGAPSNLNPFQPPLPPPLPPATTSLLDHAARLPEQHCSGPHGEACPVVAEESAGGDGTAAALARPPLPPVSLATLLTPLLLVLSALAQRGVGLALGLFEALVAKVYQYIIDPAPPGSWPVRAFEAAVTGPLKPAMLEFFAASGDFTRRVTAIPANSKFACPSSTASSYWSGAPSDLGSVVASLREAHGVDAVLCWHSLSAYWAGVAPADGHPGVSKYNARLVYAAPTPGVVEVEPSMRWNPAVIAGVGVVEDVGAFYGDLHAYLAGCGIAGVKVDGQAGAGLVGSALGGGPATAGAFQAALEASVATHFPDNTTINCMCHSTENLFRMTGSSLVRASDDFYPRDPASSAGHLAACASNSVFLAGVLSPDWDMFHSRHPAARAHAAARAVSGGPVYVSDAPGCHDFRVLSSLVLEDGRTLRARLPGRPTPGTLFSDPMTDNATLLTVWNVNDFSALVAVLHTQGSTWSRARRRFEVHDRAPGGLATVVSPADLPLASTTGPGADLARPWVAHVSGAAGLVLLAGVDEGVKVELGAGEAASVTLAPVSTLPPPSSPIAFAPVGAASMLNAGGAVTGFSLEPATATEVAGGGGGGGGPAAGGLARVAVKGLKEILCYSSVEPLAVVEASTGTPLAWRYNARDGALRVAPPRPEARAVVAAVRGSERAPEGASSAAGNAPARLPPPPGDWGFEVALPGQGVARPPPEADPAASAAAAVQ